MSARDVHRKLVGWLLAALLGVFLPSRSTPIWARSLAAPHRQTVPMTPPPTWTPDKPAAPTPSPTRPKPTPQPAPVPVPWMAFGAEPTVIAPNSRVVLRLELANVGGAPLLDARVTLDEPLEVPYTTIRVSLGEVDVETSRVIWSPGPLAAGAGGTIEIVGLVADDVLPDGTIPLRAEMSAPGVQSQVQEIALTLPRALLPDAGGE